MAGVDHMSHTQALSLSQSKQFHARPTQKSRPRKTAFRTSVDDVAPVRTSVGDVVKVRGPHLRFWRFAIASQIHPEIECAGDDNLSLNDDN